MRKLTADWIFPVSSSPIKEGVMIIDEGGKILSVGERKDFDSTPDKTGLEIHRGIICPGFINSHCHLELSYMKGRMREHTGLVDFIFQVLKTRNDDEEGVREAITSADLEMFHGGIVGVGDISNATTSFHQKLKSRLRYHTFVECFGLIPEKASAYFEESKNVFIEARLLGLDASITPHAPYSMSDELFRMIFSFDQNHPPLFSYHNQESEEENKLYLGEKSAFDEFYHSFNLPSTPHRRNLSSLEAHLQFFPREKKMLLVHNTFTGGEEINRQSSRLNHRVFFCFCPNANLYIENRVPDFRLFMDFNDRICLGTDSYASNHQLSILEEMKTIQHHDSSISTEQLIQWATLNGAKFFGWENEVGSLEGGKKPGVNLISFINSQLQFTPESKVVRLI